MWVKILVTSCVLSLQVEAFCPVNCLCDENNPSVKCERAQLNVVPSLLNPHLKRLDLAYNTIQNINDVLTYYQVLEQLNLSRNRIESLGEGNLKELKSLKELDLSFNNLTNLNSNSLKGLQSLTVLNLSHNGLTDLPPEVLLYSPKLTILNLAKNRLHTLAANVFSAQRELLQLDLCDNIFRSVPRASLATLKSLQTLTMCRNRLTVLKTRDLQNPNLLSVSFLSNSISSIDSKAFVDASSLLSINLDDNLLEEVPTRSFHPLQSLESLHLSRNKVTVIRSGAFSGLSSLLVLEMTRCPFLEHIRPGALDSSPKLNSLELSHNPLLQHFPPHLLTPASELRILNLKANGLQTIAQESVPLKSLKSLDLRDNPIVCNCSLLWLGEILILSNRTIEIPDIKCSGPEKLRRVYLSRVSSNQMLCVDPLMQVIVCASVICLSSILIGGLFFLVCRYRRRPHLDKLSTNCEWIERPLRPMESWPPEDHHHIQTQSSHIITDDYFYHTFPSLRKVPVTEV